MKTFVGPLLYVLNLNKVLSFLCFMMHRSLHVFPSKQQLAFHAINVHHKDFTCDDLSRMDLPRSNVHDICEKVSDVAVDVLFIDSLEYVFECCYLSLAFNTVEDSK